MKLLEVLKKRLNAHILYYIDGRVLTLDVLDTYTAEKTRYGNLMRFSSIQLSHTLLLHARVVRDGKIYCIIGKANHIFNMVTIPSQLRKRFSVLAAEFDDGTPVTETLQLMQPSLKITPYYLYRIVRNGKEPSKEFELTVYIQDERRGFDILTFSMHTTITFNHCSP